jgi:hypothetical protein
MKKKDFVIISSEFCNSLIMKGDVILKYEMTNLKTFNIHY